MNGVAYVLSYLAGDESFSSTDTLLSPHPGRCNMDFLFLCFPHSLCQLYNWRYRKLGNLPHVNMWPEYRVANPGFFFDFQLIDVQDFNGVGESEPNPYFYQVGIERPYHAIE